MRQTLKAAFAALALAVVPLAPATAQSLFAPVARVNDGVVTRWEVDQRAQFLTLFRTPGDVRQIAIERLIEERLQLQAAEEAGIVVSEEAVLAGMEEFASRTELPLPEFLAALAQGGVSEEAFRAFVRAGLSWRQLVQSRFVAGARPTTEEVDARLLETGTVAGARVLLTEIVLPGSDPATFAASRTRAEELARINDPDAFRAAARRFSAAPTASTGGELDWRVLSALPEDVQGAIARLSPGQTTAPIFLETAIVIFHLRDREELPAAGPEDRAIDYAVLRLGSPEAAARLRTTATTCNDFYEAAEGLPEDRLTRETVDEDALPGPVAAALATLDRGEIGTLPGDPASLVMLCGITLDTPAAAARELVFQEVANRNLTRAAERFLAELRARAEIVRVE